MRRAHAAAAIAALCAAPVPAGAALVEVSFENRTAITDSNVAAAIGQSSGNFDSGDGRVGIASGLDFALSTTAFDAEGESAAGEVGVRWGIEADHCLGAGGCGGGDHFVDATAELAVVIEVDDSVETFELVLAVQSYGNLNGVVDGGTLPACTSEMSAPMLEVATTGGVTAVVGPRTGLLSVSDAGDCTQDGDWFKDEELTVTVSGPGGGTFELLLRQSGGVTSVRQTDFFAVKNGSDTCFRAGFDPGDGIAFYDACDYPGLADADGDRDGDGLLGNEPADGGVWVTDRPGVPAIELTALELVPPEAPAAGAAFRALLALGLVLAGARTARGGRLRS